MELKMEEDVLDELKASNLVIPPEITITPVVSPFISYDTTHTSTNANASSNYPPAPPITKAQQQQISTNANAYTSSTPTSKKVTSLERSKYGQLLTIIEEIGKDIRPSYTGSKSSSERLKRGIMNARVLVRECLSEVERSARQVMNFKHADTFYTNYCADTVEWCPILNYQSFFVCGTYELQTSTRIGQLQLFSVSDDKLSLRLHCTTAKTAAVLDTKWCSKVLNDSRPILAAANADGKLTIWALTNAAEDNLYGLECISEYKINTEHVLSLSLDWFADLKICVSDSAGCITLVDVDQHHFSKIKISHYETWSSIFHVSNENLIYTGSDDSCMRTVDLRQSSSSHNKEIKEHTCGVTSLRVNHLREHILASGSYDEAIKLWDNRNLKKSFSTCQVGGGIWRIKWDTTFSAEYMLAAAMYSGVFLLQQNSNSSSSSDLNVVAQFKEHKSIAYGADFCHIHSKQQVAAHEEYAHSKGILVATCSFYDKKLCLSVL